MIAPIPSAGGPQQEDFCRTVVNAIPIPVFLVDSDVRIEDFNSAAGAMLGADRSLIIQRRGGDVLHCVHASDVPEGCGRGPFCDDCIVRNTVNSAFSGHKVERRFAEMELVSGAATKRFRLMVTASPFKYKGTELALLILEDMTELATLRGLLPICSRCKKIRDDKQYWHGVEDYLRSRMGLEFTHGLCPKCAEEFMRSMPSRPPER